MITTNKSSEKNKNNKVNIYISLPLQKTSKASSVDLTSTSVHPATYMLWFWSSRSILDWGGLKYEIQHEITSVATEWENKLFSHVAIKRSLCMGVYRQVKQKHKTGSQDKSWQHLKAKRQDTQNSYTKKISKGRKSIYEWISLATYMNSMLFLRGVPAPFHLMKKQNTFIYKLSS